MSVLHLANLNKTICYLQRNGLKNTWRAVQERLELAGETTYSWQPLSPLAWKAGRDRSLELIREAERAGEGSMGGAPAFSILVPAYHTDPKFLMELLDSVRNQTYPRWELLILDASMDDGVRNVLREFCGAGEIPLSEEKAGESIPQNCGSDQASSQGEAAEPGWQSGVIRYVKLTENGGISKNTNAGLPLAKGDYIGLVDHDDALTADALECMAEAITAGGRTADSGVRVQENPLAMDTTARTAETGPAVDRRFSVRLLYSDEDTWNGEADGYYEPNFKEDFNLDLLLSNNYIGHFLVLERELFRELKLRGEYDGAQDYDLVLRSAERIGEECWTAQEAEIVHIPKVLYHWRCHRASTAENPRSKPYAYEAGRRALQDYADRQGLQARAVHLKNVGYYRLEYSMGETVAGNAEEKAASLPAVLQQRPDLGAVGGKVTAEKKYRPSPRKQAGNIKKGSLVGGRMDASGKVYYYGLKPGYSGYYHRAALTQDAEAVDLRCICVAEAYRGLFEEVTGVPYVTRPESQWFDSAALPAGADVAELSLRFGRALRQQGKRILWDPQVEIRQNSKNKTPI